MFVLIFIPYPTEIFDQIKNTHTHTHTNLSYLDILPQRLEEQGFS